ncbi:MAG: hypothetical protein Q7S96_02250 [bacterium]|nr:hypothetical protein [bacterium]
MSERPPLDALDVYRATCMLLSDQPKAPVDALLFHAKANGDQRGLIEFVASEQRRGLAQYIAINGSAGEALGGTTPGEAWPGAVEYTNQLCFLGVPPEAIICTRPAFHTRDENDAFLALARERSWRRVAIVTHPHQILRAFLGMVRAMGDAPLVVYAQTPPHTNWSIVVFGSQGAEAMTRREHIHAEFKRIAAYQAKGDLAEFWQLHEYLGERAHMERSAR